LLDEEYFMNITSSIGMQLDAMEANLVSPAVTSSDVKTAMEDSVSASGFEREVVVTKVDDGDTFMFMDDKGEEVTVRMAGCDCPEGGTERGKVAKQFLTDLILGKTVQLKIDKFTPTEVYGRMLAVVYLGDLNLNVHVIRSCMAAPLTKFGRHHYLDMDQLKDAADKCVMGWPMEAILHVFTKPERCMVFVDGRDSGMLSGRGDLRVPVGSHRLTFAKIGFGALNVDVVLEPKIYDFTYELQKLGSTDGIVRIRSLSGGKEVSAIVMVNDGVVGLSPVITTLPVDVSTKIGIVSSSRDPVYKDVTAKIGEIVEFSVDFEYEV